MSSLSSSVDRFLSDFPFECSESGEFEPVLVSQADGFFDLFDGDVFAESEVFDFAIKG